MANSVFQIKRTSVPGRAANSTILPNPGELAINMADQIMYSTNGTTIFEIGSNATNIRVTGNAIIKAIIANGSLGTAGHVLHSNGTALYWAADDTSAGGGVTSVDTGNGLTGGPITTTGTVSVLANSGIVANTTGLFVNAAYIGTLSANNTTYLNGKLEGALNVNSATSATTATNSTQLGGKTEGNLNVNSATNATTATNATQLGGVAAASYVQNTDSRTLSGNLVFSGANANFTGNLRITGGLIANSSLGTASHVLHTNGTSVYWGPDDNSGGTVTSVASGDGLTGGTITTTGTLSVVANSGIVANTSGIFASAVPENTQTVSSYTLTISDPGKMITFANSSATTLTVPNNTSAAIALDSRIDFIQYGTGQVTVAAGTGVTIRSSGSKLKLVGQYSGATLWKKDTNEWVLIGDITT